jgi:hypothetical protein
MKTITLIIFSLIIYSFQGQAQTQELLDNTWYLEKVVIDEVEYLTPSNDEINQVILDFDTDFINTYPAPSECFAFLGSIDFNNNNSSFSNSDASPSFPECNQEENSNFYVYYIDEFYWLESGNETQIFEYNITEESSTLKKLTITNTNNDQAVYYSETLSIQDVDGFGTVRLYPNPAQDKFSIESDLSLDIIKIYNQLGQLVEKFDVKDTQSSYDISTLSTGLYFVELSSVQGKKTVKKLVKQ